jgi:hypothetical protein
MKGKMIKVLVFLLFTVVFAARVISQSHVVYIPSDKLARIKIDGNTDDWNWVPQKYFINGAKMYNNYLISNTIYNKKDWDCKILIAWNDITNKIYIVATIFDNVRRSIPESVFGVTRLCDDNLQVIINPDNSSGDCWNKIAYPDLHRLVRLSIHTPCSEGNAKFILDYGPSWYIGHKELINCGWSTRKNSSNGLFETSYELEMALWDEWSDMGIEFSSRHVLSADQRIKLAIILDDVDKTMNMIDNEWVTCFQPYWWSKIPQLTEFIMDHSSERDFHWSGIMSVLQP